MSKKLEPRALTPLEQSYLRHVMVGFSMLIVNSYIYKCVQMTPELSNIAHKVVEQKELCK